MAFPLDITELDDLEAKGYPNPFDVDSLERWYR